MNGFPLHDEPRLQIKIRKTYTIEMAAVTSGKKLSELRVIDLKHELEERGLPVSGTKPVLTDRLMDVSFCNISTTNFCLEINKFYIPKSQYRSESNLSVKKILERKSCRR